MSGMVAAEDETYCTPHSTLVFFDSISTITFFS